MHFVPQYDKISLLKEAGLAVFYTAKSINILTIQDAAINAECKLTKQEDLGDHIIFVGKVVVISADENIKPMINHNGKYLIVEDFHKPSVDVLDKIEKLHEKYNRINHQTYPQP